MEAISPEQVKVLDAHIPHTESYKKQQADIEKLKANDAEIIKELDNLNHGQEKLEEKVDAGFEKGRVRMDGIERMIIDSDKKRDEQHGEVIKKIDNKEMKELRDELRTRKELSGKMIVAIVVLVTGSLISYLAWSIGKITGVQ